MQIPQQRQEINLDQVTLIFHTDSEGRVAFVDYDVLLRAELLPEHIKGTSIFFEEDNRYFIKIEDNYSRVEYINGAWYFHPLESWKRLVDSKPCSRSYQ